MLSLQYYACVHCDAVHADLDAPVACGRCGHRGVNAFDDVTRGLRDASYFAPSARD